jgi:hypothetical protein
MKKPVSRARESTGGGRWRRNPIPDQENKKKDIATTDMGNSSGYRGTAQRCDHPDRLAGVTPAAQRGRGGPSPGIARAPRQGHSLGAGATSLVRAHDSSMSAQARRVAPARSIGNESQSCHHGSARPDRKRGFDPDTTITTTTCGGAGSSWCRSTGGDPSSADGQFSDLLPL